MKICKKCNIEKDFEHFYSDKYSKDGYRGSCKECDKNYNSQNKERRREYVRRHNNSQKRKDYLEKYKEVNKDAISEKRKYRYEENKEKELAKQKEYRESNKDIINERERYKYHKIEDKKTYNKKKNDKSKEYRKKYYESNKNRILESTKEYYSQNKESINQYREKYKPIRRLKRKSNYDYRMKNDRLFCLAESIRSLVKQSFKRNNFRKNSKTFDIIGCSCEEFKIYLESKFEDWMSWENKGLYNGETNYGWDIDHIIPISTAKTEEDILRLNHYTNLQPLCSYINRVIKRDRQ